MKVVWVAWITLVSWAHDQCCDHWIVFRSIPSCTISHNGLRNINHSWRVWAIFNWVSKVIRVCFAFALLRPVIGWQNSRHFPIQWETKPIRMVYSHAFSRAWRRLHVYVCCDWLEWEYFGIGLYGTQMKTALVSEELFTSRRESDRGKIITECTEKGGKCWKRLTRAVERRSSYQQSTVWQTHIK